MNLFQRIDPRRSLGAAIGWLAIALSACLVLAANFWLTSVVRSTLLEQHGQRLEGAGDHVGAELETALSLRLQSLTTLAAMLTDEVQRSDAERLARTLAAVRGNVPDVAWMAVTDANGDIVAATDGELVGANVYQTTWGSQGLDIAWVEEGEATGERFLRLTAPVRDAHGAIIGVVAARFGWHWVETLMAGIRASPGVWLLIDRDGQVRHGPDALRGRAWASTVTPLTPFDTTLAGLGPDASDLPSRIEVRRLLDAKPYLVANAPAVPHGTLDKLGWKVVVIEPVETVTAFATGVRWRIAVTLLALGAVAAFAGVTMARRVARRVGVIARSADAVLAGDASQIEVPPGSDEAARLGTALDRLLTTLQRERDELRALNAELDARVAQRTDEIRRLAAEARDAAVVRERLKIARDLHDTLAHSMMAMLTEIRLLKRLAATQPSALPDELLRAEEAAHDGLREARNAITQMRHNPVRDIGLGPALAELLKGYGERTGLFTRFEADDAVRLYAQERAETLFRIAEEALRNVERHAAATQVRVELRAGGGGGLTLKVQDDGRGFDPQAVPAGHYGLQGLREQAEVIGAELAIASGAAGQRGTTIEVRLAAA